MTKRLTVEERLYSKVNKTLECWIWTASRTPGGYGQIRITGKSLAAHRVSWELANGPIPDGLCVLHLCDIRPCINPAHLFLGTKADNTRDMLAKGRDASGERNGSKTKPDRIARGERRWNARLNAALVAQIRLEYAAGGISQRSIARKFGVRQQAISNVVRGATWRHVT